MTKEDKINKPPIVGVPVFLKCDFGPSSLTYCSNCIDFKKFIINGPNKIEIINARSETLKSKTSFQKVNRCIFLANGYFEWKRENSKKIPYYHTFKEKKMFIGGIYDLTGACIVTRESYPKLAKIHHSQPILLKHADFDNWFKDSHDFKCNFSEKNQEHSFNSLCYKTKFYKVCRKQVSNFYTQ